MTVHQMNHLINIKCQSIINFYKCIQLQDEIFKRQKISFLKGGQVYIFILLYVDISITITLSKQSLKNTLTLTLH